MKYWVVRDRANPNKHVVIGSTFLPVDAVAEAPKVNGKYITNAEIIDIIQVPVGDGTLAATKSVAVVNPEKQQEFQTKLTGRLQRIEDKSIARLARVAKAREEIKGIDLEKVKTIKQVKVVLKGIIDTLDIED